MAVAVVNIIYWLASLSFIVGLKQMSHPKTARKGNNFMFIGMMAAILVTIILPYQSLNGNLVWILGGVISGSLIGLKLAQKVQMTEMPQLVSLFNGFGGLGALVIAFIELSNFSIPIMGAGIRYFVLLMTLVVGSIAFSGSMGAFLKLHGKWKDKRSLSKKYLAHFFLLTCGILIFVMVLGELNNRLIISVLCISAGAYGIFFVGNIGGGDMPVVISFLNSITGISSALAGLIFDSQIMLISGILVGASGTVLTIIMCLAMNRSIKQVFLGGPISKSKKNSSEEIDKVVQEIGYSDLAMLLAFSKNVIIVPGYGMAVAKAQKVCKQIEDQIRSNHVDLKYAIHPVAGRMPGHMNVLLAEANVSYDKLMDLEEANEEFKNTDVALVIGANDVINPAATNSEDSPIYGMPVLRVWDAKNVIVLKRSLSTGYAGVENPLFNMENTKLLFGDAKDTLVKVCDELKSCI